MSGQKIGNRRMEEAGNNFFVVMWNYKVNLETQKGDSRGFCGFARIFEVEFNDFRVKRS